MRTDRKQPISDLITQHSQAADLTLLGIQLPDADQVSDYGERVNNLVQSVGIVLMVRNASQDDLLSTD